MKTRCPHCDTLYDIDDAILASAEFTAVCCQCHRVFTVAPTESEQAPSELVTRQAQEAADTPKISQPHPLEEAPETPADRTDSPDQGEDDWAFVQENKARTESRPAPSMASDVPHDFNSLAAAELPADHFTGTSAASKKAGWPIMLGLLACTLSALGQLGWINQQALLENPQTRHYLQQFCDLAGCNLEQVSATDKFNILHRDLQPAISHQQALSLTLSFTNEADFVQPLPAVRLRLLDEREQPLAQRIFTPDEYLYPASAADRRMRPKEILNLELLLHDTGLNAAGFELDFL